MKISLLPEIQEYLDFRQQRRWIFPRAALVGAGAGLMALLFRAALTGADALRNGLIAWAQRMPMWGWIFPILFSALGVRLSGGSEHSREPGRTPVRPHERIIRCVRGPRSFSIFL